ncbi:CaiB/BaiF CoA-transferase family protein [Bordetella sp. 15P40C-2]|uniref:CaiB/BaiF CoA transferase family protein n=1 Tax=Bordetella sp. 15P40C-2 TaxID=2572246 RepID=UPI00132C3AE5|nr:CoA transferase [Bordetella sp. 15P40C-2]MVW70719.1 CoA transferase [Bordetella sp. 15P40C-2]
MDLPLSKIRVLDVSQIMAGPFCCMLLGDMGADVIKIEPPGVGDQTRKAMGFKLKGEDSGGFIALNRNKRSVEINLKSEAGLEAFYELVKTADVLVENNRPGVAKRLKIDYDVLKEINPRLVYASISGFGQTGPWALRPGLDLIAQATSGVMSAMGHPGGIPVKSSIPLADLGAGLFCTYGILSALMGREHTGVGQYVDASLFETALGLSVWETAEFWGTNKLPQPIGSANRMSAPYQAVKASDRHFVIGAANQKLWTALCRAIGGDALLEDPRYATNADRIKNLAPLIESLEAIFATRTAQEWVDIILEAGVPAAPILDYHEATTNEHAQARQMVLPIEHPVEGRVNTLGFPVKLSRTPQVVRHAPPLLGQHTREVLLESGIDPERFEKLAAQGAFAK